MSVSVWHQLVMSEQLSFPLVFLFLQTNSNSCCNIFVMLCTVLSFSPDVLVWDFKFDCAFSVPSIST